MRRGHAVLVAVLACGLILGGTAVVGGIGPGVTDGADAPETATLSQVECSYPVEVTDATGEPVTIEEEPDEVVALAASDAQVLWALDAEAKVTGLPFANTGYLEDRETLPGGENRTDIAGQFGAPVIEEVVGLEPDLVVAASAMFEEDVQALRDAGLTVYHAADEQSIEDVYSYIERVGQLVNRCEEATAVVEGMQENVSFIEEAIADEPRPSVFYAQVPGEGWTAGAGTVEADMIETAGGENVGTELDVEGYDQVSEEAIVEADPDWILVSEGSAQSLPDALSTTTAMQEDQIIEISANNISQPGPRMVTPIETIAGALHSEALEQARNGENSSGDDSTGDDGTGDDSDDGTGDDSDDGTGDDTGDDSDDGTGDDTGDDSTDTGDGDADDDGAGLTVVAALAALAALGAVTARLGS